MKTDHIQNRKLAVGFQRSKTIFHMLRERRFVSQGELINLLVSRGGLLPAAHSDVERNKESSTITGVNNECLEVQCTQIEISQYQLFTITKVSFTYPM